MKRKENLGREEEEETDRKFRKRLERLCSFTRWEDSCCSGTLCYSIFGKTDTAALSITTSSIEHRMHFYEWKPTHRLFAIPPRIYDRDADNRDADNRDVVLTRFHDLLSCFARLTRLIMAARFARILPPNLTLFFRTLFILSSSRSVSSLWFTELIFVSKTRIMHLIKCKRNWE